MSNLDPVKDLRDALDTTPCICCIDDAQFLEDLRDAATAFLDALPGMLAAAWERGYQARPTPWAPPDVTPPGEFHEGWVDGARANAGDEVRRMTGAEGD